MREIGRRGTIPHFHGSSAILAEYRPQPTPPTDPGPRPKFPTDADGFLAELRRRVAGHFAGPRRERDCWPMYLKTAVILAWTATAYGLLVFAATAWWQAVPLAVALALGMAAVAFNVAHDGGHAAYSRRRWVNRLSAFSLDLVGASSYLWHHKHNVVHHTYVNIAGHDTDIDLGRLMRLCPSQPRLWFHRWQHLYLWPLYGLSAVRWHLYSDFREVADGRIGPHRVRRPRGWNLAGFVFGKAASVGLLLGLPLAVHPWWVVVLVYLLVMGVLGVATCAVFQLAHCVEEADFPLPADDSPSMESCWAVHQVETTVDFARGSRALTWLLGGLNFQVVHHLFPRVCHVHYPALAVIVEQTCREYGVRYSAHPTLWAGLVSHYRWLREMGRSDGRRRVR